MRRFYLQATKVFAVLLILSAPAAAADLAAEFQSVKRAIQQQLRSRKPADRADAIRRLEGYPVLDAAKLMVPLAFKGQPDEVRRAGFQTLLTFKDNAEICKFLVETLRHEAPRGTRETVYPLISVLLASELPEVQADLLAVLDHFASTNKTGMLLLLTLADDLGKEADALSLSALINLAKSELMVREFPYRRSIVQAMTRIHEEAAVEALIKLMGQIDGEARGDIISYLKEITGEDFETDAAAWSKWWEENKEDFTFPSAAQIVIRKVSSSVPNSLASYYGLPLYAKRLVFVLDTSHSMSGQKLTQAKQELIYAINRLAPGTEFSVVAYNSRVRAWNTKLVPASGESKQSATKYVMAQDADGMTASYDALQTAFAYNAEAVYFLTDGKPTAGKIVPPNQIVAAISEANRLQRKSVYTIGIDAQRGGFDEFLKALAEKNFGVYRAVDE